MNSQPSPIKTPVKTEEENTIFFEVMDADNRWICTVMEREDAEAIRDALNSHARLVELLKKARLVFDISCLRDDVLNRQSIDNIARQIDEVTQALASEQR